MNIIDAVRSGRPFKRRDESSFYRDIVINEVVIFDDDSVLYCGVSREDILADDWEIYDPWNTHRESGVEL